MDLSVDGQAVEEDEQHIVSESNTGSCCLVLTGLTMDDSGQFMCYATNCMGNASTLAKIVVDGELEHKTWSLILESYT